MGKNMIDETPKIDTENKGYILLRDRKIPEFNSLHEKGMIDTNLSGLSFRAFDLRKLSAGGLDFSNCRFKQTDVRGVNFADAKLEGASFYGAKISVAYFPPEFSAQEILLSVTHGTRLRKNRS